MGFRHRHGDRPLDGYTILRGIGQGGFGEVYAAQSDGGRDVALKVIQQNHEIELRGVRQCMNLKSPHLVTIFDVRTDDADVPYVIMEHVHGPSFRQVVQSAPRGLDLATVAYLLREMGKGLSYLHEHGIVHRDLKPENIFFEDGYVKIGDYGLSKYISVSHQSGQTISVGTVHYMAPEIGSGIYQRSIDIYALGVILYELLTGSVPFNGDSMGEILMKHLSCEPDVSAIDPTLQDVVKKALAKRPEERYLRVEDMVEALLACDGVASSLDGYQPTSLGSFAPPGGALSDQPVDSLPPPSVDPPPSRNEQPEPKASASPRPGAAAPQDEVAAAKSSGGLFRAADLDQRIFTSLVTGAAMGMAVWLISGQTKILPVWTATAIATIALPILLVEGWLAPRLRLEKGIARNFATFAFAVPPVVAVLASGGYHRSWPALLAALFFVNWGARLEPKRPERVSLTDALTAGLFGFSVALCTRGNPVFCAGVLAAVSLVLNAFAPFSRRSSNKKEVPKAPRVPQPPKVAPSPVPPQAAPRAAAHPPKVAVPPNQGAASAPEPPSRLVRTRDAILAGVCGGIAARYAVDVAWVRFAFLLSIVLTAGWALVAYLGMWVCMPPQRFYSPSAGGRTARPAARVLWFVASGLLLVPAVFCIGTVVEALAKHSYAPPPEIAGVFAIGAFLALASGFAFFRGRSRRKTVFWRGAVQPLLVLALVSIAAGGTLVAFIAQDTDEFPLGVASAVIGGVLGTLLGFNWLRWYRGRWLAEDALARGETEWSPYEPHAGWQSLAMLFMALAFAAFGAGTLFEVALANQAFGSENLLADPWGVQSHWAGPAAGILSAVFFLPGLFCLLMARRDGGGAHVLRGAVGSVLASVLILGLTAMVRSTYWSQFSGVGASLGEPQEQIKVLLLLLLLGASSAAFLAWPAKGKRRKIHTPLAAQAVEGHS